MPARRPPESVTASELPTGSMPYGARQPASREPAPGLALAWGPRGLLTDDRAPISAELTVGRSASCRYCVRAPLLSRQHFSIAPREPGRFVLRDLGSRHGVLVDGTRCDGERAVGAGSVIAAGGCVFVVVPDLWALAPVEVGSAALPMAGRFHAAVVLDQLRVAARTGHHLLLEGESGTGKELAAKALHGELGRLGRGGPLVAHNAACFAGEDDALGVIFGVARGAFSGVAGRAGAVEAAHLGTLFLDEVHALPLRGQRALLRWVEDGRIHRLGEPVGAASSADVRLICGTNVDVERACADGLLASDLVARLYRIEIPPLRARRADVPSIFERLLVEGSAPELAEAVLSALDAGTVERLCRHDYRQGNVRELRRLVASIAARAALGTSPELAVAQAVDELVSSPLAGAEGGGGPEAESAARSPYDANKADILAAYQSLGGNLSRMVESLDARGVATTRQGLARALERWGLRPVPRRPRA